MNYFFSKNYNGFIYTVDMFRISTRISRFDKLDITKFLSTMNLKFWNDKHAGKYDENFMADKLWIGITKEKKHDSSISDANENFLFTLEFNPNKVTFNDIFIYNYFINQFEFRVKRFDLAIDIPHNINELCFFDIFKKSYSVFYNTFDNKTYYIGKGDGHIKIYNKKLESDLNYELTRFEVTRETDFSFASIPYIDFKFPIISFTPYRSFSEDSTIKAICYAVNTGFPYKSLSRTYKDLIKKEYIGLKDLNNRVANEVISQFCKLVESGISNKPDNLHYITLDI